MTSSYSDERMEAQKLKFFTDMDTCPEPRIDTDEMCGQGPSWDTLPTDVLLLLFKRLSIYSLATCLYVSKTWRNHVEHILEAKNRWEELCGTIGDFAEFQRKCMRTCDWPQMFYNRSRWFSFHRATIKLHQIREFDGIKRINVYRDDLVVATNVSSRYYDAKTLNIQPNALELPLCDEFFENDFMVVEAHKTKGLLALQFHIKLKSTKMYLTTCMPYKIINILCYKVDNNKCHVLDSRNVHYLYSCIDTAEGRVWREETVGRYYGNPTSACALNVFKNKCYLMLKGGFIMLMDGNIGHYKMLTLIDEEETKRIPKLVLITENCKEIYREIHTWFSLSNFQVYSREVEVLPKVGPIDHISLWSSLDGAGGAIINPHISGNVSCALQHGGVLFLGHLDGTVELISSRHLLRDLCETKPLRSFNITDFKDGITDLAVKAIDVAEDEAVQHLYIATSTQLFHLHIHSPNYDYWM